MTSLPISFWNFPAQSVFFCFGNSASSVLLSQTRRPVSTPFIKAAAFSNTLMQPAVIWRLQVPATAKSTSMSFFCGLAKLLAGLFHWTSKSVSLNGPGRWKTGLWHHYEGGVPCKSVRFSHNLSHHRAKQARAQNICCFKGTSQLAGEILDRWLAGCLEVWQKDMQ